MYTWRKCIIQWSRNVSNKSIFDKIAQLINISLGWKSSFVFKNVENLQSLRNYANIFTQVCLKLGMNYCLSEKLTSDLNQPQPSDHCLPPFCKLTMDDTLFLKQVIKQLVKKNSNKINYQHFTCHMTQIAFIIGIRFCLVWFTSRKLILY